MILWTLESSQVPNGLGAPVSLVKACILDKSKRTKAAKKLPENDAPAGLDGLDIDEEESKVYDLIVARDNGRIEIYSYTLDTPFPIMCFEHQIKSTITSVDVGNVTMANSKDILLSCYDGKILALVDAKKFKK